MLDYKKRVLDTQLRPPADADGQCLKTNKGACLIRTTGYVPSCERENAKNPLVCIISAVPLPKITRVGNNRSENVKTTTPRKILLLFLRCAVCVDVLGSEVWNVYCGHLDHAYTAAVLHMYACVYIYLEEHPTDLE